MGCDGGPYCGEILPEGRLWKELDDGVQDEEAFVVMHLAGDELLEDPQQALHSQRSSTAKKRQ